MMKFAVISVLILASFVSGRRWTKRPSYYDYNDYRKQVVTAGYDANGLKCYLCTSSISSGCGEDKFTPSEATKTTCAAGEVCVKGVIGEVAYRGCIPVDEELANNECHAADKMSFEICYCSTDLCNSALNNNLGLVLAFVAFLVAKYL